MQVTLSYQDLRTIFVIARSLGVMGEPRETKSGEMASTTRSKEGSTSAPAAAPSAAGHGWNLFYYDRDQAIDASQVRC